MIFWPQELTWETLSHLGSRRRIRQLHEEGMDSEDGGECVRTGLWDAGKVLG